MINSKTSWNSCTLTHVLMKRSLRWQVNFKRVIQRVLVTIVMRIVLHCSLPHLVRCYISRLIRMSFWSIASPIIFAITSLVVSILLILCYLLCFATMLDDGRSYASSTTMLSSNQKTSMSSKDENQSNYMKSPAFNESIKTE